MLTGALIMESLRVGAVLEDPGLAVRRLSRVAPVDVTTHQPPAWTLMEFASAAAEPELLAQDLAAVIDSPGWYAISTQKDWCTSSSVTRYFATRAGMTPGTSRQWLMRRQLAFRWPSATGGNGGPAPHGVRTCLERHAARVVAAYVMPFPRNRRVTDMTAPDPACSDR